MRFLLFLFCLATFLSACKKKAVCGKNCVDIRVSGKVIDAVNNVGIGNQTIYVKWKKNGMCLIGCLIDVNSGKTDNNGNFDFVVTIDSSKFSSNYRLIAEVPTPTDYLDDYGLHSSVSSYNYSPSALSNLQIRFLPKATLTVRMHRTLNDNFTYFSNSVFYLNTHTSMSSMYNIYSPSLAKDTSFTREVVAGNYTYIISRKATSPGVSTEKKDSVICTRQGPNVFDVYY